MSGKFCPFYGAELLALNLPQQPMFWWSDHITSQHHRTKTISFFGQQWFIWAHLSPFHFIRSLYRLKFISVNDLISRSSSWECVIFRSILVSGLNLLARVSTTALKDSSFSQESSTWFQALPVSQVQGEISGRTEHWSDARWKTVYIMEVILAADH